MAQDGVWVVPTDGPAPPWPPPQGLPVYDFDLIAGLEGLIAQGESGWRELYAELGLTPCEVVYEELSGDGYERTIRAHRIWAGSMVSSRSQLGRPA
jgi:LPS sulfotransferase NodH